MLVLARKKGESIIIGDNIRVVVLQISHSGVKLGIAADGVVIRREECKKIGVTEGETHAGE